MSRGDLYVWRPPAAVRWSEALLGGLLGLVGAVLVVARPSDWPGLVLLVPAAVLLLGTRRACRLGAEATVVQGRVFRRVVRLRDLRQVGVCLDGRTWLQTQDGEVTLLRMVPLVDYGSGHAGPTPVERLRAAGRDAGARLDPALRAPEQPPTTKPLLLGMCGSGLDHHRDDHRPAAVGSRLTQRPTTRRMVCWSW